MQYNNATLQLYCCYSFVSLAEHTHRNLKASCEWKCNHNFRRNSWLYTCMCVCQSASRICKVRATVWDVSIWSFRKSPEYPAWYISTGALIIVHSRVLVTLSREELWFYNCVRMLFFCIEFSRVIFSYMTMKTISNYLQHYGKIFIYDSSKFNIADARHIFISDSL